VELQMKFKGQTAMEFRTSKIKPELRALLEALDKFVTEKQYPEIVVTELTRIAKHVGDQHSVGEAADVRAHNGYYSAEQLAHMCNFVTESHFRKDMNAAGRQMRAFYAHGSGDNFHIHLSIDKG